MTRPYARHVLPEFTERPDPGSRTSDPYAKLLEERIVLLGTEIDDTAANDVTAQFVYLEHRAPDRDIALYINSPAAPSAPCRRSTTRCGTSPATWRRPAWARPAPWPPSCSPRAPRASGRCSPAHARCCASRGGGAGAGQATDLAIQADEAARVRTRLEELLARHTGRTPEQVSADVERDTVLDARQALEYGLVDHLVAGREGARPAPGAR